MSDTPEANRIPLMPPERAQAIACGLKWMAQSYLEAGLTRDAVRADRDSQWWMTYALSLSQMPQSRLTTGGRSGTPT